MEKDVVAFCIEPSFFSMYSPDKSIPFSASTFRPMLAWLAMSLTVLSAACFLLFVISVVYHRLVLRVGSPILLRMRDGTAVYSIAGDVGFHVVYHEIYELGVYCRSETNLEGVTAPLVVDCGANVGLFSRFMLQKYPNAWVIAAEPIEDLVKVAKQNVDFAADRFQVSTVGLGKANGTAEFDFLPTLSCGSGIPKHLESATKLAMTVDPIALLRALMLDSISAGSVPRWLPLSTLCSLLRVAYARVLACLVFSPLLLLLCSYLAGAHIPKKRLQCEVVVLDELLRRHGVEEKQLIDLLKIDVEGAELDLLEGISDRLWPRIQRAVVETQDIDNNIERIRRFLVSKGFSKVTQVDEDLEVQKLTRITTFFATR